MTLMRTYVRTPGVLPQAPFAAASTRRSATGSASSACTTRAARRMIRYARCGRGALVGHTVMRRWSRLPAVRVRETSREPS
jgi:hypothetical protein